MKTGIIILVAILVLGLVLGGVTMRSLGSSQGRCLVTENGTVMLIKDNSPIVLSGNLPDGLSTGDHILVFHDGIQETYPGKTKAALVIRLGGGTEGDIPQTVKDSLTEMGWLP